MAEAVQPYRLGTFAIAGCQPFGGILIEDDKVLSLRAAASIDPALPLYGAQTLEALVQNWEAHRDTLDAIVQRIRASPAGLPLVPLAQLEVCPPLQPKSLLCAGMNYRKHVLDFFEDDPAEKEKWARSLDQRASSGLPFMFAKPGGAVAGPDVDVVIPPNVNQLDWEIELIAVISRPTWQVSVDQALDHVAAYTLANDISARDLMPRDDVQPGLNDFFGGKSGPNFNPTGPFLLPSQFVPDPQDLWLTLRLNGRVMQDEGTRDMIHSVAQLIAFASTRTVLQAGDMISTGSPSGNAKHHDRYLKAGDLIEAECLPIGRQHIRICAT